MISRAITSLFLSGTLLFADVPVSKPTPGLSVTVLQGENVVHSLPNPSSSHLSVRIADGVGRPIKNAVTIFELPEIGATATFPDGGKTKVVLSDTDGAATVEIRPNSTPGHYTPKITVNFLGQTTTVILKQENAFGPEVRPAAYRSTLTGKKQRSAFRISGKTLLIISGVAGATAVAVFAGKGGSSGPAGGGIVITPGSGTVGGK